MPHKHPLPPLNHPRAPKPELALSELIPEFSAPPLFPREFFFAAEQKYSIFPKRLFFFLGRVPVGENPENNIKFDDTTIIRLVKYS